MGNVKLISIKDLLSEEFDRFLRSQGILTEYLHETMMHQTKDPLFDNEDFDIYHYLSGDTMGDAFVFNMSLRGGDFWEKQYVNWTNRRNNILVHLN